jgi:putative transposase
VISLRQVINAILYILKTGCQWRQLPREFPAWIAVYYYFSSWSCNGAWERLHHLLRARLREQCGRHKHPTAGELWSNLVYRESSGVLLLISGLFDAIDEFHAANDLG